MQKHKNELIFTTRKARQGRKVGYLCEGSADFDDVHEYAAAIASLLEAIRNESSDGRNAVLLAIMAYIDRECELEEGED